MNISPKEQTLIAFLILVIAALYYITQTIILPRYAEEYPATETIDFCRNNVCGPEEQCNTCIKDCGICAGYELKFFDTYSTNCEKLSKTEYKCENNETGQNLLLFFRNTGTEKLINITTETLCSVKSDSGTFQLNNIFGFFYQLNNATLEEEKHVIEELQAGGLAGYTLTAELTDILRKNICEITNNEKADITCNVKAVSADGLSAETNVVLRVDTTEFVVPGFCI